MAENAEKLASLAQLPDSCAASAEKLEQQRGIYEKGGIFDPAMIDGIITMLKSYKDSDLRRRMKEDPGLEAELVRRYYYCG